MLPLVRVRLQERARPRQQVLRVRLPARVQLRALLQGLLRPRVLLQGQVQPRQQALWALPPELVRLRALQQVLVRPREPLLEQVGLRPVHFEPGR